MEVIYNEDGLMKTRTIQIGNHSIGPACPPFIVAEMSGNHNRSLARALEIVEAAAQAGVQAVKLQTYTAETMTLDIGQGEFRINDAASLWHGKTLYNLYDEAHTPWEWHKPIFDHCRKHGLICFSTPFDETAVDFLEELNVPCYKIASFELTDLPLIRKVAATGKPLMMSIGMATVAEIDEAVTTARQAGCGGIVLLKCTSTYPALPVNSNIFTLPHMKDLFDCHVGLSDHTLGIGVAVASVVLGASVIEKHFTLNRDEGGVDAAFSLELEEMRSLAHEANNAWQAMGKVAYGPTSAEEQSLNYRRSLYLVKDMQLGEVITKDNVKAIRPGFGLSPKYYDLVLGRKVKKIVPRGTPLSWEIIS